MFVGPRLHYKMQLSAGHDLVMPQKRARQRLVIESDGSYIPICLAEIVHHHGELLSVGKMQHCMVHERATDDVLPRARRNRIKTERRELEPRRLLPQVIYTGRAVRRRPKL